MPAENKKRTQPGDGRRFFLACIVASSVTNSPIPGYFSIRLVRLTCARQKLADPAADGATVLQGAPRQNNCETPKGAPAHRIGLIMKNTLLLSVMIATTMAAAGTAGVAVAAPQPDSFRGNAAPAQAAVDQVIVINDATRHVNVAGGSTVRFVVGDRSFTWCFQNGTARVIPFDLQLIAPKGLLNHPVTTYVSDNPLYMNS
jgi:hypothetical protein